MNRSFLKICLSITSQNKDNKCSNTIAQVFIRRYLRILQTNNKKEFFYNDLSAYLYWKGVEHKLNSSYHPQSK